MANCRLMRRQLETVEYDPDALPPSVAAHLTQCAECRAYAAQMRSLRTLLAEQPRVTPPASFDAEIRLRLGREAHRFQEPWLAWIPTPVLASIATVFVVAGAFAVRSSLQSVQSALRGPSPTVAEALTRPPFPEPTPATAFSARLGGDAPATRAALPRPSPMVARFGRVAPATARAATPSVNETGGVVVLWRGPSGERVMRLPKVVYGVRPIVERRAAFGGEASDDSAF